VGTTLATRLKRRLRDIDAVDEGSSIFSEDEAVPGYFVDGKQIAHFYAPDVVEIRLTKALIRADRERLKADTRVELRKNSSDWLKVRFKTSADLAFIVDLVEAASAAHRPVSGRPPRPPPSGAELARRRRFH
jgi:hypothetical protein